MQYSLRLPPLSLRSKRKKKKEKERKRSWFQRGKWWELSQHRQIWRKRHFYWSTSVYCFSTQGTEYKLNHVWKGNWAPKQQQLLHFRWLNWSLQNVQLGSWPRKKTLFLLLPHDVLHKHPVLWLYCFLHSDFSCLPTLFTVSWFHPQVSSTSFVDASSCATGSGTDLPHPA